MDTDRFSRGWSYSDLAVEAGVNVSTVTRFLKSEVQTPNVAKKLAIALGHPLSRYVKNAQAEALAS